MWGSMTEAMYLQWQVVGLVPYLFGANPSAPPANETTSEREMRELLEEDIYEYGND